MMPPVHPDGAKGIAYDRAAREVCSGGDPLAALQSLAGGDPPVDAAQADVAALTGSSLDDVGRGVTRWERQHVEIVCSITSGDIPRATGLLEQHVAEFGCDPVAVHLLTGRTCPDCPSTPLL